MSGHRKSFHADRNAKMAREAGGRVHHVSDLGPFARLDARATCDAAGRAVTLAVVNRDRERPHGATMDLGDAEAVQVDLAEVNGPDVSATNDFSAPDRVGVRERRLDLRARRLERVFPAHSVSVVRLRLAG